MKPLAIVILAAGKGTRMKSNLAKVLHPIAGVPMLCYSLDLARALRPERIVVVVGFQRELIRERFSAPDITFVDQVEQLGTGHAVQRALTALEDFQGTVLILCGDVPLLREETLRAFRARHDESQAALSVLTAILPDPSGYGRIIRKKNGAPLRIVEDRDLRPEERNIQEINTGIYCVEKAFLLAALGNLKNQNAQKEFYLTDIVERASQEKRKVQAFPSPDPIEVMGVNTRIDLAQANQSMYQKIAQAHMLAGVTVLDPRSTYIDREVRIGKDTVIHPNCYLSGKTTIGEGCLLEPGCKIADSRLEDGVTVRGFSVITESTIGSQAVVGPFAHLRPGTILREGVHVGNFVEVKKSILGKGTKANHLTYLGDATIGERVNVGAGTITCNYDGVKKHPTVIEDGAFIGSNTELVAPVRIGRNALIGAGSTITKEVPPDTLAVSRVKQTHYPRRNPRKE